jgi:hypothetical protein
MPKKSIGTAAKASDQMAPEPATPAAGATTDRIDTPIAEPTPMETTSSVPALLLSRDANLLFSNSL